LVAYPLLALLSFPTFETLIWHTRAWMYTLDVFDDGGGLPRLAIAVRDWSANGLTLWDPYLTAGNALLGQFALPPYAPDVALAFIVGPFWALAMWSWLTAALAGIGTHYFLRDSVGVSTPAALAGSVLAVFCFWHPIYGVSVAILPLLLWLGDGAARSGPNRRRFAAGALLAAGLALYAGQLQVAIFIAAIQLCWFLVNRPGGRWTSVGIWFGTWAIAFGLYAPILLTQLVMVPISERSVWNLNYLYDGGFAQAASTILHHYGGVFLGIPLDPGWVPSEPRYGTLFLGGIGLTLALVGLLAGPQRRSRVFLLSVLLVIPILDFTAILAAQSFQQDLGVLRSFQFVRIRHFFPFALTAVVALGVDAIMATGLEAGQWRRSAAVITALGLLALIGIQTGIAASVAAAHVSRFAGLPRDVGWVLAALALAVGLIGGLALVVVVLRRVAAPTRAVVIALGILFVAERALVAAGGPLLGPFIGSFRDRLGLTSGQAFLLGQPGIGGERVLTFGDDANRMAFHGLRQADGYQAIYPVAYHAFFGALTAPGLLADMSRYRYFHYWGARAYVFSPRVDAQLVALAGVRWLYVRGAQVPRIPGIVKRFRQGNVTVYEHPAAFPRAFLVGAVQRGSNSQVVLNDLMNASLTQLKGRVYATGGDATPLMTAVGPPGESLSTGFAGRPGPAGVAQITSERPDRVEIDVQARRPAILVLTDVAAPGWTAEVDGRSVTVRTVDVAFRGIPIDVRARHVVFRYEPAFTTVGFGLAAISVAPALLWVWCLGGGGSRWRRRQALG
jgi:hypothetical protein